MKKDLQRDIFLSGEGDAWFNRNKVDASLMDSQPDLLYPLLCDLPLEDGLNSSVVEVGCGQGLRLKGLANKRGWKIMGLDPSVEAVSAACQLGVDAQVGTAEKLPYPSHSIDLLIYGFCLYLCDRDDLFQISSEAHRVLKPAGWLAILDFWSPHQRSNVYHHRDGILSHKMNLPEMFSWHPSYVITDHRLRHHSLQVHTDDPDEWVAATLIRRLDHSDSFTDS